MRRTLSAGLVFASLAAVIASCSSAPPATPSPTVEAPSWDPRSDQIEQAAKIWESHRPPAYAYTFDHAGGDGTSWRYRVSGLEGGEQLQHLAGTAQPDSALDAMTVPGLYEVARTALANPAFTFAYDRLRGYPTSLNLVTATEGIGGFVTSANTGSANDARTALGALLDRWHDRQGGTWEYTWSRIPAGGGAPTTWTVRRDRKAITARQVSAGDTPVTTDDVGIDATALAITNALGSGGWADVAIEDDPGLGVLIAVDPSPSTTGDAYWIRITWTDLLLRAAISDLDAAKARWATAQLTDYSYTWTFKGADGSALAYKVAHKGADTTVTPQGDTPAADSVPYATPSVEDTFTLIGAVLDQGGTVKATYDDELGYPKRVELTPQGAAGAEGVITIGGLKHR